jgi:UDP-N-acetylmuramate-alanine ligase
VSGSDVADSPRLHALRRLGATVHLQHAAAHLDPAVRVPEPRATGTIAEGRCLLRRVRHHCAQCPI